jgi:phosphoribosylglycinamide formyltransferase, formyltetrahydrofolate-dependent
MKKKVAVLVSGGGTNLQALLDAQRAGTLGNAEISCVISSKAGVGALERAANAGVPSLVLAPKDYASAADFDTALASALDARAIDLVVLAGYLRIIGAEMLSRYQNRIINVHPSLIPSFCGAGFYGLKVHQSALDYGVKVTGATVHFVNDVVDGGKILLQKAVEVLPGDTPETLQLRVMQEAEWILLPRAVALLCADQ